MRAAPANPEPGSKRYHISSTPITLSRKSDKRSFASGGNGWMGQLSYRFSPDTPPRVPLPSSNAAEYTCVLDPCPIH